MARRDDGSVRSPPLGAITLPSTPRVRVYLACSLDGAVAGPGDDLSFLSDPGPADSPPADAEVLRFPEFLGQVGAMLMGRRTFDVVAGMGVEWPYGDIPVLVATRRPLGDAPPTVQAVSGPIDALVARARSLAGDADVYVDGADIVRQALTAGLIDELCLTIVPVILGRGAVRLFDGVDAKQSLEIVSSRRFDQGMVQLTVRPRR